MDRDVLSLQEAAEHLGVTRRRAQAMVQAGLLPAERIGLQWIVPVRALDFTAHTMRHSAGRPLLTSSAWERILAFDSGRESLDRRILDEWRRELRPRARHAELYVHPSLIDELRNRSDAVLSGRDAAVAAGAPVDAGDDLHLYIRDSTVAALMRDYGARVDLRNANVHLHAVPDEAWPFVPGQQFAPRWVAWLDLEDERDRAADALLDVILGGRLRA